MPDPQDPQAQPEPSDVTRVRPGRSRRSAPPEEASSPPPRPAAQSILQGLLTPGAFRGGVQLNELEDEPSLPEFRQGTDKYTVHGVLGAGGMGKVYLARDEDLHRPVALKIPRDSDPEHLARFVAEAQVMGQLHHPGIVPVFELGQSQDKRIFYSMPVVRGETLDDVLQALRTGQPEALKRWSIGRLVQAFLQVCHAVHYAHEKGVIHRDLKPSNVMVGRHGEVQVLDWGLAKVVRAGGIEADLAALQGSELGLVLGTPAYMSPEQARGDVLDARTDVWSLGAILYELLTLLSAFTGETEVVMESVQQDDPVPPRTAAPEREIPLALEAACVKALAKRRSRRHQSVQELADDVQSWLDAESDRVRRRQLADAKVAEARVLVAERERLSGEIVRLDAEAQEMAKGLEGWQPWQEKLPVIAAADAVEATRDQLTDASSRLLSTLTEALGHDAEHAEARGMLGDYYWNLLREAESRGHAREVRFFSKLTAAYHDGKYARELAGNGSLELTSDPPGAEVWLHDFVEEGFVLRESNSRLLGLTPLPRTVLPMGSHLVVLRKAGFRDTRYPVFISRNKEWTGDVALFTDEEIGAGFVHVPAGPFLLGGDPECRGAELPRSEPWVEDFFLAVHPVTDAEYIEFLNALAAREGIAAAKARSPRRVWNEPTTSYLVERNGRLERPEVDEREISWLPGHPVFAISWHDAVAYCAWRSERDGREVRLPTEPEWEKAARGVDGRWYPWGNRFDPSCCNMGERSRRPKEGVLVSVEEMASRFPADASVYGVRGCAGNVRDWTATPGSGSANLHVVRGGFWQDYRIYTRCAYRYEASSVLTSVGVGFRLAMSARRTRG